MGKTNSRPSTIRPRHKQLVDDVQNLGMGNRYIVVAADDSDTREWLTDAAVCPALSLYNIVHTGVMKVESGLEVVRTDQSGSFFMACIDGEGEVLFDGGWKRLRAGNACLLPPFVLNSFRSLPGRPWQFVWVRYLERRDAQPIGTSHSPVQGVFNHRALESAVEGLHAESLGDNFPSSLNLWTELIHQYVKLFSSPKRSNDRLWKLWNEVEKALHHPWSLNELADTGFMSAEHLRRLCKKQLGRSPMQHLTFLRMKKARHMLSSTNDKIEVIAAAVGYRNPFTFSNTFKQWIGWRPSELR